MAWLASLLGEAETGGSVSAMALISATLTAAIGLLVWLVRHLLTVTLPEQQKACTSGLERLLERMDRQAEVVVKCGEAIRENQVGLTQAVKTAEELYEEFAVFAMEWRDVTADQRRKMRERRPHDPPPPGGVPPGAPPARP